MGFVQTGRSKEGGAKKSRDTPDVIRDVQDTKKTSASASGGNASDTSKGYCSLFN